MKRTIKHIVIHCSATPNGQPFKAADIDRWHKDRKFKRGSQAARNFNPHLPSIGYHGVIGIEGLIESGRSLEEVGAHVQGNNANSIGVCMIGTDEFSVKQFIALQVWLMDVAEKISGKKVLTIQGALKAYADMGISIKGHRDYSPDLNGDGQITRNEWTKICPGFDVAKLIASWS